MKAAINTLLILLAMFMAVFVVVPFVHATGVDGGYVESPQERCEGLAGHNTGTKSWNQSLYGNNPTICASSCVYRISRGSGVNITLCTGGTGNYTCSSDFVASGEVCSNDGFYAGGDFPEPDNGKDSNGNGIPDDIETILDVAPIELNPNVSCYDEASCVAVGRGISNMTEVVNRGNVNLSHIRELLAKLTLNDERLEQTLDQRVMVGIREGMDLEGQSIRNEISRTDSALRVHVNSKFDDLTADSKRMFEETLDLKFTEFLESPDMFGGELNEIKENTERALSNIRSVSSFYSTDMGEIRFQHGKINRGIAALDSKLADILAAGSGSGSVDLSPLEGSIAGLGTDIDGLSADIKGLDDGLGRLGESVGRVEGLLAGDGLVSRNGKGVGLVDFSDGYLVSESSMTAVKKDIESLEGKAGEFRDKFKSLFGFDESTLNNGSYQDHTLDLFVNGKTQSFTSGVFPALVANAGLISSVVILLAVLAGIRLLGKD